MGIQLGPVNLDGFEVAAQIRFGGAQKLTVHKLPGGLRVIDAMGPDDDVIAWHGILSGGDAAERARALDGLRVAGNVVALSWDIFTATVLVSDLKIEFRNSWWIPYQIACTVLVGTQLLSNADASASVLSNVLADLDLASTAPGVNIALAAVNAAGSAAAGSQPYAAAVTALLSAKLGLAGSIVSAEAGMSGSDIPSLVSTAGDLASFTAAAGFLGRATANYTQADF